MRHAAPLATPEDVAWFLASYARDARARIELAELPALATVRTALEEALGLKFEGEKGEHFFRSSLVQTLFYGVFSAWVLWSQTNARFQPAPGSRQDAGATVASQQVAGGTAHFNWYETARYLRVPMISKLFQLVASPQELEALKLTEVLDWAGLVLNRVDRAAFFAKFQETHAVQYFYEPFLEAFDPELRKQLGVWYTPPEIVQYMVARVDTGAARGTGPARRPGRPERLRARPLLRHRGVSGRGAADRFAARCKRQGRGRPARRASSRKRRHGARVRL